MKRSEFQRGMTMVEVLVALVIMSIGMLGIAALYVETMRANRTALLRSQAISFVNDMADRIRANSGVASITASNPYDTDTYGGSPATQGCVAGGTNCTEAELAEDDLARWIAAVQARTGLPGVLINEVQYTAGNPAQYMIHVQWKEPNQDPANPLDVYDYRANIEILPAL